MKKDVLESTLINMTCMEKLLILISFDYSFHLKWQVRNHILNLLFTRDYWIMQGCRERLQAWRHNLNSICSVNHFLSHIVLKIRELCLPNRIFLMRRMYVNLNYFQYWILYRTLRLIKNFWKYPSVPSSNIESNVINILLPTCFGYILCHVSIFETAW
jgi:hypothetical protein